MKRVSLEIFGLASVPLFRVSIFGPLRIDTKRFYEWAQCTDVDPACKLSKRSILWRILKTRWTTPFGVWESPMPYGSVCQIGFR